MKYYVSMMFLLLIGFFMIGISACGTSTGYYSTNVHYRSGWGYPHHHHHHYHRPIPPRPRPPRPIPPRPSRPIKR